MDLHSPQIVGLVTLSVQRFFYYGSHFYYGIHNLHRRPIRIGMYIHVWRPSSSESDFIVGHVCPQDVSVHVRERIGYIQPVDLHSPQIVGLVTWSVQRFFTMAHIP